MEKAVLEQLLSGPWYPPSLTGWRNENNGVRLRSEPAIDPWDFMASGRTTSLLASPQVYFVRRIDEARRHDGPLVPDKTGGLILRDQAASGDGATEPISVYEACYILYFRYGKAKKPLPQPSHRLPRRPPRASNQW